VLEFFSSLNEFSDLRLSTGKGNKKKIMRKRKPVFLLKIKTFLANSGDLEVLLMLLLA
jgi:hypothetical protein